MSIQPSDSSVSPTNAPPASAPAELAFRGVMRTYGLLERIMHPHFARFGISGAQWGVLRMLHRASSEGQPALRLTDLSNRLLIRPPTGTAVVDRLEQMGLLQREASATDLRSKIVCLTPRGRELVERVLLVHSKQICAVLSGLNLQEQTELQELLGRLCRHLDCMLANGAPPCVE